MKTSSRANPLELTVTNFGPIAEGKIELRPMTVFVGPSNTGKSYMAALVYALHTSFRASHQRDVQPDFSKERFRVRIMDSLEGSPLSENDIDQVRRWLKETVIHSQSSRIPSPKLQELQDSVAKRVRAILESGDNVIPYILDELSRSIGVEVLGELVSHPFRGNFSFSFGRGKSTKPNSDVCFTYRGEVSEVGVSVEASIPDIPAMPIGEEFAGEFNHWQWLMFQFFGNEARGGDTARIALSQLASDSAFNMMDPLGRPAFYLPADRAGVMHAHQVVVRALIAGASRSPLRPDMPLPSVSGVLGDFLEQIVAFAGANNQESGTYNALAKQLENKLLQGAIRAERSEIDYPFFIYRPAGWRQDLPLKNTSSMVTELAPVVLYLRHVVQPGNLLIIEEPEAHLHPEMQAKFTRQLVAAVQSGIRILITTHSEWILEELANLVRLSELPADRRDGIGDPEIAIRPDQLGTWFFEPNPDARGSVVREISLDEESATFPAGFGLVTEALYNRWVEISTRIQEEYPI
ncbi:MAG: AAA family ATPase [Caldilineaceae bacterium SB0661_bin_32]|uniref:AAA family ATPase n=1 Tax=Caldilineaceae bacterium SB0661_bin_32 TaxID=2605255 RepID=A0A6B1DBF5_9CHLR|nr:AAA family ATPase [Caldilineaceae bacterium SB0661_bin_32]